MKLMGHRGARDRAPENTLRSFAAALESGVPAIEFDIHQSRDGVWVVHHDETLDRTTTSSGRVSDRTWAELSQVRTKEGDPLPRLEEVLTLCAPHAIELQIEIKSAGDFRNLGEILASFPEPRRLTLISFNHRWLKEFKTLCPQYKTTCLLFGHPVNPVEIARSAQAEGLSLSVNWIDEALVSECHAAGLSVTAWNANDLQTFKRMKALDVDYLGTDQPFTARSW